MDNCGASGYDGHGYRENKRKRTFRITCKTIESDRKDRNKKDNTEETDSHSTTQSTLQLEHKERQKLFVQVETQPQEAQRFQTSCRQTNTAVQAGRPRSTYLSCEQHKSWTK